MKILLYMAMSVVVLTMTLVSCSGESSAVDSAEADAHTAFLPHTVDNAAPNDSDVFAIGVEDAEKMLAECRKIEEIELHLLDIKARIHLIDTRIGRQAAEDYTKGFVHGVKTRNDSLAKVLF